MNLEELERMDEEKRKARADDDEEPEEEDYADDEEEEEQSDVSNALVLLQDCEQLLAVIVSKWEGKKGIEIQSFIRRQVVKIGQEIQLFLNDFDMEEGK